MNGARVLVDALEAHGVEYIFGVPGHGNTNILDALVDSSIEFKLVRHEQAAAHIADGYARMTGKVGVCCTSVGPGAANLLMGLGTAISTSSPVLAIVGLPIKKWLGRGQLQETSRPDSTNIDQAFTQMLQPVTKRTWSAWDAEMIPSAVRKAFTTARVGRPGPVAIEIPWDVQSGECDVPPEAPDIFADSRRQRASREDTTRAAKLLAEAELPVLMVGNGVRLSDAGQATIALAEALGAPMSGSFVGKGAVPEDHPLAVGISGWLGHPIAHELIREHADVVLAIGYRFSDQSTSWWTEGLPFVPQNKIIHIDPEPREMGRTYPVEIGLVGDARAVLEDLLVEVAALGGRSSAAASTAMVAAAKDKFELELPPLDSQPMQPMRITQQVRDVLPAKSIMSVDTGNHAHYYSCYYPILEGGHFLNPGGWTPMGWGPAAIIGAKLAHPELPAVAVTGDGGFLMICQEVATAVDWDVPIVWLVYNNQALAAIRDSQKADFGGRVIGTEFTVPVDFAAMARSMGAEGIRVESHDGVEAALQQALDFGRPCVIDLIVDADAEHPPVAGSWFEPGRGEPAPKPRGSERLYT
ncbi:MAG: thiamine pyrophosphate-binding protein [Chloroflexota bacterium]|jgi:acetolactate synthase-1/2/3 large subunit|nr:thiamine pyrophosphate-binding protein [Chloroflexota bacterium]MDP6507787.1 thiamine pyrophosphate-binding protein [Chloroflexota bacterium]MDP6757314.1 thiamine pyrophosphate-binding protein [Chloroflexota bacterium]